MILHDGQTSEGVKRPVLSQELAPSIDGLVVTSMTIALHTGNGCHFTFPFLATHQSLSL